LKLRTFLHVGEKTPPDALHPIQGALPDLKLVWQPSMQLLEVLSSSANFAIIEPFAGGGVCVVGDVGRDATVFAACVGLCGFAACFGAWTVMLGSWLAGPVAVCATAVPLSNTVVRTARAEGATRLDDSLITRYPKSGNECRPGADAVSRVQPAFPKK
jgi:hypothetical protein